MFYLNSDIENAFKYENLIFLEQLFLSFQKPEKEDFALYTTQLKSIKINQFIFSFYKNDIFFQNVLLKNMIINKNKDVFFSVFKDFPIQDIPETSKIKIILDVIDTNDKEWLDTIISKLPPYYQIFALREFFEYLMKPNPEQDTYYRQQIYDFHQTADYTRYPQLMDDILNVYQKRQNNILKTNQNFLSFFQNFICDLHQDLFIPIYKHIYPHIKNLNLDEIKSCYSKIKISQNISHLYEEKKETYKNKI